MIIVHYIPDIDQRSGGTATYMQLMAKALGTKAQLHILTHRTSNPLAIDHCTLHYLPPYRPWHWAWTRQVRTLLEAIAPQVVHVNCCWMPACAAVVGVARSLHLPVALTTHGMLEPWIMNRHYWTRKWPALHLYQARALRSADVLVATADREARHLRQLGFNDHIAVVPSGIDITRVPMKTSWEKSHTMLFLGRIHQVKGIWHLIEAVARVQSQLNGYRVVIAGEGAPDDIQRLRQAIADRHLASCVSYIGGAYGDRKWQLLREADFVVQPSFTENFGLTIAEALASGTPVITTNTTPWEQLDATASGTCIEVGASPLANAITRFVALSSAELETMGRNARHLIETQFSVEVMGTTMMEVYREIIV